MTLIYAILIFSILIILHEFGHFITAKMCGVKVNEFSVGMGPAILKKQKGETLYAVRLFPIGGYCAMEGEDEESDDERAFGNKKAWQKAIIVCAGAFMNLLLAIVIMAAVSFSAGVPTNTIDKVYTGEPAAIAGIESGDTILSVDGKKTETWKDVYTSIAESSGETIALSVRKGNGTTTEISSRVKLEEGTDRRIIGIRPYVERSIITSLKEGVTDTWNLAIGMLDVIKQLIHGDIAAKELSGPVGIVAVVNDTASRGFIYVAVIAAVISLNLAIVNMLPFPALDGGRLVFIIIRAFTGKAITDEMEGKVHFVGIMLLFGLMIYVTWNDILRFIVPLFR